MKLLRAMLAVYGRAFAGLPREVWLLCLTLFVNRAGTMVLPFLSLYLTREMELSAVAAGRIIACFGIGSMAGAFLGGWLSDRMSPLVVQQLSLAGSGVGFLLLTRLDSPLPIAIGVLLVALVADALRPALMVSISHYSPPEALKRSYALVRLAANLGMAIGPAVAGFLAQASYTWLFVADALTCWAAALILVAVFGPGRRRPVTAGDHEPASGVALQRDLPFMVFLLLVMLLAMVFFQVWTTLPLHLRAFYGTGERGIGLLLSVNAALIVLFEMLVIRAAEQCDSLRTVGAGAFLVCAGLALVPLGPPLAVAVAAMVVLTFGEMLALPISNTVVAERAGRARTGRAMGLYTLAFSAAFVVGPVAGTAVFERFGPAALWYGIGGIGVVLWLGFSALSPAFRRPA